MNLKKIGKVLTSKSVGTEPSSCEKRIYRAAVSQRLRNTAIGCFALRSPSINRYKLRWESSGAISAFDCISYHILWFVLYCEIFSCLSVLY